MKCCDTCGDPFKGNPGNRKYCSTECWPHGTRGAYNRGCKCDQCRTANADYVRRNHHLRQSADYQVVPTMECGICGRPCSIIGCRRRAALPVSVNSYERPTMTLTPEQETGAEALYRITCLESEAAWVASMPLPLELTAEAAGRVNKVARDLQDVKRSWLAEAGPAPSTAPVGGYRIATTNKCDRTFNTARIVHDLAEADGLTYAQELDALIREGALKVVWAWQKVQKAFRGRDVPMDITFHEIGDDGDLDAPHVGEVWESTNTVQGADQ